MGLTGTVDSKLLYTGSCTGNKDLYLLLIRMNLYLLRPTYM